MHWASVLGECFKRVFELVHWASDLSECTGRVSWAIVLDQCLKRVHWASVLSECTGRIIVTLCAQLTRMCCTQWNQNTYNLSLETVAQFLTNKLSCNSFQGQLACTLALCYLCLFFPKQQCSFCNRQSVFTARYDLRYVFTVLKLGRAVPQAVSRLLLADKITLSLVIVSTPQLHISDIGERRTQEYSHCYRNSHPRTPSMTNIATIPDNFQTRSWSPNRHACCLLGHVKC